MALTETQGHAVGIYVPVEDASGNLIQTLVAAKRGLSIEETSDTQDISHSDNWGWAKKMAGQKDWSATVNGLLLIDDSNGDFEPAQQALLDAFRNGTQVLVQVRRPGGQMEEGNALITGITREYPHDGQATYDVSLEGSDGQGLSTQPIP